jgi:hypothetical protein
VNTQSLQGTPSTFHYQNPSENLRKFRYSNQLVYNNYPWPESPSDNERAAVEEAARSVQAARDEELAKRATLAELYDAIATPPRLAKAHVALDRAVDRCYRNQRFISERLRVEFLFGLYETITAPVIAASRKKRKKPLAP